MEIYYDFKYFLTEISKILPDQVDKVQSKEYYPSTRPLGQNKLKTWY
ncbi:MAG: hypothetical protein QG646_4549 [Euryarchaeota archaeon]|nr:hypothetical protein [Euryarchaeota archaeon]